MVFNLSPLMVLEQALTILFALVGLVFLMVKRKSLESDLKKWLLIFSTLGVISVFTNNIFHQVSFSSAVIGSLAYFKIFSLVPVFFWTRHPERSYFTLRYFRMFGLLWFISLLILYVLNVNLNFKSPFTGTEMIVEVSRLNKNIINLLSIYYLALFFMKRTNRYMVISFILFGANFFGDFQRYIFICFILTVLLGFFVQRSVLIRIRLLPIALASFIAGTAFLSNADYGRLIMKKYSDVGFLFADQGSKTDYSVSARLWESDIAINGFWEHPLLGNGVFRSGVKEQLFGDVHFYLSDVGLLGILYAFGIIGLIVFLLQLRFYFSISPSSIIDLWVKLSVLFTMLYSILTGTSILMPSVFMVVILIRSMGDRSLGAEFSRSNGW